MTIEETFSKLSKSPFHARFHLSAEDRNYIKRIGMDALRRHAEEFIRTRLAPAFPPNDGKQTPMRGHPVFVAQHACACCCRDCLNKWYHVPKGIPLTDAQQQKIVNLLISWIEKDPQR